MWQGDGAGRGGSRAPPRSPVPNILRPFRSMCFQNHTTRGLLRLCSFFHLAFSGLIHVAACRSTPFLFYGRIILHCVDRLHLFLLSSVAGHLGCFHFSVMNNAAVNSHVQCFLWMDISLLLGLYPGVGLLGRLGTREVPVWRTPSLCPRVLHRFTFPAAGAKRPVSPHPCPHSPSRWVWSGASRCGLDLYFLGGPCVTLSIFPCICWLFVHLPWRISRFFAHF